MATNENPRLREINIALEQLRRVEKFLHEAQGAEMSITEGQAQFQEADVGKMRTAALATYMARRSTANLEYRLKSLIQFFYKTDC